MVRIRYDKVGHLLALGNNSERAQRSGIPAISTDLEIKFSDYVKSQIHLNLVSKLYDRDILVYGKALRFIKGEAEYRDSAKQVFGYYVTDMLQFLKSNPVNVQLDCLVDVDFGLALSESPHKEDFWRFCDALEENIDADFSVKREILHKFGFEEVIEYSDSLDSIIQKRDSYYTIAVLLNWREQLC